VCSSDTAVRAAVEKYDLKPDKDVIILQGGGQSERFAALKAGAVDAAIVSPPLNLAGRKMGFNEVLAAWKDPAKKSLVMGHVAKYLRLDPEKNKDQIEETYRYYSKTFSTKPYSTGEGLEF